MSDAAEQVILVDREDRAIGIAPKLEVHRSGVLHRAFSVLIYDGKGRLLLQRRNRGKYHSGGLWSNACCGHPRPDEHVMAAARRRLQEELGFDCDLLPVRTFIYRADVGAGLIEHELVHIFSGCWRGRVLPDPDEVEAYAWRVLESVHREVAENPTAYTAWFPLYLGLAEFPACEG
jgi:isopentenyl-diphosphate delta-isomerase